MDGLQINQLKRNMVVEISHQRKGKFTARILAIVPGDEEKPEDPNQRYDPEFIRVIYDVREGTTQAHMKTTAGNRYRQSDLRPSLINRITEVESHNWLLEVKLPDEEPEESFGRKFVNLFRKRGD